MSEDYCLCGAYWHSSVEHDSREEAPAPPLDTTPQGMLPSRWDTRAYPLPEWVSNYVLPDGARPERQS